MRCCEFFLFFPSSLELFPVVEFLLPYDLGDKPPFQRFSRRFLPVFSYHNASEEGFAYPLSPCDVERYHFPFLFPSSPLFSPRVSPQWFFLATGTGGHYRKAFLPVWGCLRHIPPPFCATPDYAAPSCPFFFPLSVMLCSFLFFGPNRPSRVRASPPPPPVHFF